MTLGYVKVVFGSKKTKANFLGRYFVLQSRHGKMRDPGSRKFLNNYGNVLLKSNKMVVFNTNKTFFVLIMMK